MLTREQYDQAMSLCKHRIAYGNIVQAAVAQAMLWRLEAGLKEIYWS